MVEKMNENIDNPIYNLVEHCSITDNQREEAKKIICDRYDSSDRIDSAEIEKEGDDVVMTVYVNKGNVGQGVIDERFVLRN
jgi:hypothetical protein